MKHKNNLKNIKSSNKGFNEKGLVSRTKEEIAVYGQVPFSDIAEQAILGCLILDINCWNEISNIIKVEDFYREKHQIIHKTILDLLAKNATVDVLTIIENLEFKKQLSKIGGDYYVFELIKNIPSITNISSYANIIREKSILRQLFYIGNKISHIALQYQDKSINNILDEAESSIFAISQNSLNKNNTGPQDIQTVMRNTVNQIDFLCKNGSGLSGISSGFLDLDEKTSGFQNGDMIIIAGRPSMGKTAFAINIASNISLDKDKLPVLIFSMEMPAEQIALRLISNLSSVDQQTLKRGNLSSKDWWHITDSVSTLTDARIFIDDTPALTPIDIRTRARRVVRETGNLGLIVIDYLQLMQTAGKHENRSMEIAYISRSIKSLAKELKVPILALSQLNRGLELRADKRPMMSDLRESGSLEQDSDLILFIYRDEVYDKNTAAIAHFGLKALSYQLD